MTLREIAEDLQTPQSTVRLYRDEFEAFLEFTGTGRRRRYTEGGAETLRQVVRWKLDGWTSARIREELGRIHAPTRQAKRRSAEERWDEVAALLRAQQSEIALLRVEVGALRAEVKRWADRAGPQNTPTIDSVWGAD